MQLLYRGIVGFWISLLSVATLHNDVQAGLELKLKLKLKLKQPFG